MIADPALPARLERLAIFPLPDSQLFPHALLPLHVFEPRYRALARDCLAGSRRMAVAMLEPGFESDYDGRPAVKAVCGVGEVVQSHLYPDGRYDILLTGLGRARILEELPPNEPYRLVVAERLDDHFAPGQDLSASMHSLVALCDRMATLIPSGAETLHALARQETDPGATADAIAAALLTEPDDRQQILETLDVGRRIERVAAAVSSLLARFSAMKSPGSSSMN